MRSIVLRATFLIIKSFQFNIKFYKSWIKVTIQFDLNYGFIRYKYDTDSLKNVSIIIRNEKYCSESDIFVDGHYWLDSCCCWHILPSKLYGACKTDMICVWIVSTALEIPTKTKLNTSQLAQLPFIISNQVNHSWLW